MGRVNCGVPVVFACALKIMLIYRMNKEDLYIDASELKYEIYILLKHSR